MKKFSIVFAFVFIIMSLNFLPEVFATNIDFEAECKDAEDDLKSGYARVIISSPNVSYTDSESYSDETITYSTDELVSSTDPMHGTFNIQANKTFKTSNLEIFFYFELSGLTKNISYSLENYTYETIEEKFNNSGNNSYALLLSVNLSNIKDGTVKIPLVIDDEGDFWNFAKTITVNITFELSKTQEIKLKYSEWLLALLETGREGRLNYYKNVPNLPLITTEFSNNVHALNWMAGFADACGLDEDDNETIRKKIKSFFDSDKEAAITGFKAISSALKSLTEEQKYMTLPDSVPATQSNMIDLLVKEEGYIKEDVEKALNEYMKEEDLKVLSDEWIHNTINSIDDIVAAAERGEDVEEYADDINGIHTEIDNSIEETEEEVYHLMAKIDTVSEEKRTKKNFTDVLTNIEDYTPKNDDTDNSKVEEMTGKILSIITSIGMVLAVIVPAILGVKYMLGSVEEKAEYKKGMIPYVVGAFLLFGICTFVKVLQKFGESINNI